MKLTDLRKLAIHAESRIRFPLTNAMECVIDETGVVRIPGLRSTIDVDINQELEGAQQFFIDAPGARPRAVGRAELQSMIGRDASHPADHEHED
jgi:hypothetical protein